MSLDLDEIHYYKEGHKMGKTRPIFNIEVMPHVEKCRLDMAMPIRRAGIIAAQVYLDSKDKETKHIKPGVILPFAIILIVVGSLALLAWGMR